MTKSELKSIIQCLISENKKLKKKLNKQQFFSLSSAEKNQLRNMLIEQ